VTAELVLHNYWRSSASWRVRIGLELKGLAYTYAPVHLVRGGGEQLQDAYRALNPMAQVPTLEVREEGRTHLLSQSMAILEFLEERHPTPALLPADPFERATVRQLAELMNSGIQPLHNLAVVNHVAEALHGDKQAWAGKWIARGLEALEAKAKQTAGRQLFGDQLTFADVCLIPQLYAARRFGVDPGGYPTLARVEATCAALPAFQRAHADAQPDAQPA
jgi:maleylpyruvate isomerase